MKVLYIIPARGGSKGIPRKNIKEMCGKPLIQYSIEVALGLAQDPQHVIVSTEDEEIAAVATECGVPDQGYRRPEQLATDTAGSREMMLHAMDWARAKGIDFDTIVLLQPTSPLRTKEDVAECLALYGPGVDMVVSVSESADNPYYNLFESDSEGILHISKGDGHYTRRQDAPKVYAYNGAVYVIRPESLKAMPMGDFKTRKPYVMPRERSIDLDTPLDWTIAESIMSNIKNS